MAVDSRKKYSLKMKKDCAFASKSGISSREIYDKIFSPEYPGLCYESFKRRLMAWKKMQFADNDTLCAGTYEGFQAHNATVQVNNRGEIVQAWIKQAADEHQWEELLATIKENSDPVHIEPCADFDTGSMLEIPLYDLHLPLSDHTRAIKRLLGIITAKNRDEVNIIIGQDLFHNDDMRGRTSSGRIIEKVDMAKAWNMAKQIYYSLIDASLSHAKVVNLIYSFGNHDESLSWAFVQMLKDHYPQVNVDDCMKQRKCIYWNNCFIGITHGSNMKSAPKDFRGQFTIEFPREFADSTTREIHAGHLHHEQESDLYGVMIRRLSRGGITDEWSDEEGFVGAHKRFMVFEWRSGELSDIHYI